MVADLATRGCEVVRADMTDAESMVRALDSVDAVFVCVHTLLPQAVGADSDFAETELEGLRNIVGGCRSNNVSRIVYITFLGVRPDAENAWTHGRWKAEQYLLDSGLDVTVFRPGMIVGGRGFGVLISQARRPVAVILGDGERRFQHIAVTDLAYYMVASLIERISRMPRGSLRAYVHGLKTDSVGDPSPIQRILRRPPLGFTEAVKQAASAGESGKLPRCDERLRWAGR